MTRASDSETCCIDGCDKPRAKAGHARLLVCSGHYGRKRRHGDYLAHIPLNPGPTGKRLVPPPPPPPPPRVQLADEEIERLYGRTIWDALLAFRTDPYYFEQMVKAANWAEANRARWGKKPLSRST